MNEGDLFSVVEEMSDSNVQVNEIKDQSVETKVQFVAECQVNSSLSFNQKNRKGYATDITDLCHDKISTISLCNSNLPKSILA